MNEKVKRVRRNFTLSLDKERTEYVQGKLKVAGLGISSFVDMVIGELYENLMEVNKKSSAEMQADEFLDALNTLIKKMKGKYKN